MKGKHENEINRALQSIEGIGRAEASPFLYGRIMERMKQHIPQPVYATGKMILGYAFMIAIVVSVNVLTYVKSQKKVRKAGTQTEQAGLQQFAAEYFNNDNLYQY